jgi:branched-chain amino acid transport system permease protein
MRIRAVAQLPEISELLGINSRHVRILTFISGILLVSIAGALILPIYYIYPTVGLEFGVISWIIIIFGGLGSITGALAASFIVGVAESIAAAFYNVELARAIMLIVFIAVIFVKPTGMFGGRARV